MEYAEFVEKTWHVADAYFRNAHVLVNHHLHSYEHFLDSDMEKDILAANDQLVFKFDYNKKYKKFDNIYKIQFKNVAISCPLTQSQSFSDTHRPLFPMEARLKGLTYASDLYCDIVQEMQTYDKERDDYIVKQLPSFPKTSLGKFPTMVGSKYCNLHDIPPKLRRQYGECEYEQNGIFIIKGVEKVLITQEQLKERELMFFLEKKEIFTCKIHTVRQIDSSFRKEIKLTMNKNDYGIAVSIPNLFKKYNVPLGILFKALNVTSDQDIVNNILYGLTSNQIKILQPLLVDTINESSSITTQTMALQFLFGQLNSNYFSDEEKTSSIKIEAVTYEIILKNLFMHLGTSYNAKIMFLSHMTKQLLLFRIGKIKQTDRDSFLNKCLLDTGSLVRILFRNNYSKFINDLRYTVRKGMKSGKLYDDIIPNINRKIKPQQLLESSIKHSFSTGQWPSGSLSINQSFVGISQSIDRISYLKVLSTLRRVVSPMNKTMKSQEFRMLHNTQFGYFCPSETPEGKSTGIVKTLSTIATISIEEDPSIILTHIQKMGIINLSDIDIGETINKNVFVKVFVNGSFIGIHNEPAKFYASLKAKKHTGHINIFTSIVWNIEDSIIKINTDGGRLIRPMYIVKDNKLLFTREIAKKLEAGELQWNDIIANHNGNGIIEYVDVEESNTLTFAIDVRNLIENKRENASFKTYTHCEIHPSLFLGPLNINTPFANHNHGPRNLYQAAMGKAAVGIYATNHLLRMDTIGYILNFPEKQLIFTKGARYVNSHVLPHGQNIIIAIMVYTGYNQEDSLIINKGSLDRGLFSMDGFKTYRDEQKKTQKAYDEEKFMKPQRHADDGSILTKNMSYKNYDKLQENGFIKEGEAVVDGDIIIGKVIPLENSDIKYTDVSKKISRGEDGVVDKVYADTAPSGYQYVKVKIRSRRKPMIGDKFCAQCGQKGTASLFLNTEDMPYTKDGIVPDMIISIHGQIKRMTIGMTMEGVLGKVAAILGIRMDGTPFDNEPSPSDIGEALIKYGGYSSSGKEILYNGMTGEQLQSNIFVGPNKYYRLKHMVKDKIYARATGIYQLLTKQPSEGRSRGGGLRIGEMERDCMIAHGATTFLKEKMFNQSDASVYYICDKCGRFAVVNEAKNIKFCTYCGENSYEFSKIEIPYCSKLFIQEMNAQMSDMRLKTAASTK
jgi:DNA-directed RNA polymerase II subunit RPB2